MVYGLEGLTEAKAKAKATADPSLRSDGMKRRRTFLVRARGTDIPFGGRYAMKTHVGVDLHQRFCYLTAVDASGKNVQAGPGGQRGCGVAGVAAASSGSPAGGGGGERFLAGVCAGGGAGGRTAGDGASTTGEGDRVGEAEERPGGF